MTKPIPNLDEDSSPPDVTIANQPVRMLANILSVLTLALLAFVLVAVAICYSNGFVPPFPFDRPRHYPEFSVCQGSCTFALVLATPASFLALFLWPTWTRIALFAGCIAEVALYFFWLRW